MPTPPFWDRPEFRRTANELDSARLKELLAAEGLAHLRVRPYGRHLVIYSEEDGERVNRVRFTRVGRGHYELQMADHRGRWEPTPFEGRLGELFQTLTQQFRFLLADFSNF